MEAFLSQTNTEGVSNAQILNLNGNKYVPMQGVTVENGAITAIDLKGKKLTGTLDLSNFPALTKVDVSDNKLTSLIVDNCPALVELNAGRNQLQRVLRRQMSVTPDTETLSQPSSRNRSVGCAIAEEFQYFK